jgi:hypothetical protein
VIKEEQKKSQFVDVLKNTPAGQKRMWRTPAPLHPVEDYERNLVRTT